MQKLKECLIILKTQIEKDIARRPQDPFLRGEIHGLTLALYEVQKALSERSTALSERSTAPPPQNLD